MEWMHLVEIEFGFEIDRRKFALDHEIEDIHDPAVRVTRSISRTKEATEAFGMAAAEATDKFKALGEAFLLLQYPKHK
jgi:hypothetical protein